MKLIFSRNVSEEKSQTADATRNSRLSLSNNRSAISSSEHRILLAPVMTVQYAQNKAFKRLSARV